MFYPELNQELRSSFTSSQEVFANLTDHCCMPISGLKAGKLLNSNQMKKLAEIRSRKINSREMRRFELD